MTPEPPLLCSSLPSHRAPGGTLPGGVGCGSRDLGHSAPLMVGSPGSLRFLPGPIQGCTGAAPGPWVETSARSPSRVWSQHASTSAYSLNSRMRKVMAHFPQMLRPVSEECQRPPLPLEPFDSHSPPCGDSWNFIFCANTPDPRASIYLLGPGEASPELPVAPHSHPFVYSFYIPRDTCFLP